MSERLTRDELDKIPAIVLTRDQVHDLDVQMENELGRARFLAHDAALLARVRELEQVMGEVASMAGERWLEGQLMLAKVLKP